MFILTNHKNINIYAKKEYLHFKINIIQHAGLQAQIKRISVIYNPWLQTFELIDMNIKNHYHISKLFRKR